jgi:hypothetical protein
MEPAVIIWLVLFATATIRALTTAINKTYEYENDGQDEFERLVFLEDTEHWWTAVIINALLLSIGVVAAVDPVGPTGIQTWHGHYVVTGFIIFAILINVRIERHGYYFRKRNGINLLGRPRQEGLWKSLKCTLRGR